MIHSRSRLARENKVQRRESITRTVSDLDGAASTGNVSSCVRMADPKQRGLALYIYIYIYIKERLYRVTRDSGGLVSVVERLTAKGKRAAVRLLPRERCRARRR